MQRALGLHRLPPRPPVRVDEPVDRDAAADGSTSAFLDDDNNYEGDEAAIGEMGALQEGVDYNLNSLLEFNAQVQQVMKELEEIEGQGNDRSGRGDYVERFPTGRAVVRDPRVPPLLTDDPEPVGRASGARRSCRAKITVNKSSESPTRRTNDARVERITAGLRRSALPRPPPAPPSLTPLPFPVAGGGSSNQQKRHRNRHGQAHSGDMGSMGGGEADGRRLALLPRFEEDRLHEMVFRQLGIDDLP
ncbi:unnamed protein product [Vitrella brassicaformis CCMP3155]|uniref:Uncharacterized protein n=1 Tax=Vitrella brassicaformis (strain CCMP3155) TaxID=1169540 RepID=A0A0G4F5X1_VITBC|nr:unnamed protein product [Vitrella brassicaformis CCMP3155]|eukprot:CEM07766.1 unnamed protein product [Vitrella brassicaformis CCMP3155]